LESFRSTSLQLVLMEPLFHQVKTVFTQKPAVLKFSWVDVMAVVVPVVVVAASVEPVEGLSSVLETIPSGLEWVDTREPTTPQASQRSVPHMIFTQQTTTPVRS
jgi:hypothetical protein